MATPAWGAQVYQAGFRTLGAWEEDPPVRIDLNIWYPTMRQARDLSYPPWTLSGASNAKVAEGRFPLIILSHGSPADRFAHHDLASWLAREGFVVAAPTHSGDCMHNMDDLFTWQQLLRRAQEASRTIDLVLAQKELAPVVDAHRIGFVGYGSGGTTGLLLGGALPTCAPWPRYCSNASLTDVYCSPWARGRMNGLCNQLPLRRSLADPRIKAIAAIAPGFAMIFDADSFRHFYPPLLLVAAGRDQFNIRKRHADVLGRLLGSKARFLDLPLADYGALLAPCPPALTEELPELCSSVDAVERSAIQAELREALGAFFSHYLLVTGNVPTIPPPPDLEPKPEPTPTQPVIKKRRR